MVSTGYPRSHPAGLRRFPRLHALLRHATAVQEQEDAHPGGVGAHMMLRHSERTLVTVLFTGALLVVFLTDPRSGPLGQLALGAVVACWTTFVAWHESAWVRVQVLCALSVACTVEWVGTHLMGWWDYRLGNLPGWVPPGHASIALVCIVLARTPAPRWLHHTAYAGVAAWTLWGLTLAERPDYSGVFGLLIIAVVRYHPVMRPRIPWIIAVTVPTEFAGTYFAAYSYRPHDVTGLLLLANPPSGLPGGYVLVDFTALLMAAVVHRTWQRRRHSKSATP